MWRSLIVEFIGPFALMFLGGGAIMLTKGENIVAIALAHGLAIGLMIAAAGHISGGVYNPAISIGLLIAGKLSPVMAGAYIVAQCLGGIAAAVALRVAYPASTGADVIPHLGANVTFAQGFLVEVILTFFLMFSIYGSAVDKRGPSLLAPFVIGLTISIDILAAGAVTGAAMNPARVFGPAVAYGYWVDHALYWVAPIVGAAIAAVLYDKVLVKTDA